MASSRKKSAAVTGKKAASSRLAGGKAATGTVKAAHKHKVVRRRSAEMAAGAERNDLYPVKPRK
jgi:hypothetical protein